MVFKKMQKNQSKEKEWRCIDYCCWMIGYVYTTWWLLSFLYHNLPNTLKGFEVHESPGVRLNREGVTALHPVVLVPGIVSGGLELWEGRPCAEGLFRKRLWGATSFAQILKRPLCWLEHLSLDNETGLDPPGIRVRAVPGFVASNDFASGYHVREVLIENLAKIGYEGKNLYIAAYDWRLSFQNTEIRDQALSRLKSKIELMFVTNGDKKVVVVPQSMGAIYFLHFLKWVETPLPMGGGGGSGWCDKHIKAIMNVSPAFLGVPKAISSIFLAEGNDVAFFRAVTSSVINFEYLGRQTVEHVLRVCRTWDSIMSLMPKGGNTIWGHKKHFESVNNYNCSSMKKGLHMKKLIKYRGIISFGKTVSELLASLLTTLDSELEQETSFASNSATCNQSRENVRTKCDEMSGGSIPKLAKIKDYNSGRTNFDQLNFVAPKMKKYAEAHFSDGIAENLDDPKYAHHKYWSNPLETKLPEAPHMEIYCLYGVRNPTKISYDYQIDSSVDGGERKRLQNSVYDVDGEESMAVVSSGFMCAKGWRKRTRFNPSGMDTCIREYQHKLSGSFLEGRGLESGAHANIMGNVALIEDVLRVAAGATGADIGGDKIFSDIMRMSHKINLRL